MSYCRNRLSQPTSSIMASAWSVRVRKKPGMSKRVDRFDQQPDAGCRSGGAAKRRLSTSVPWACSRRRPPAACPPGSSAGGSPAPARSRWPAPRLRGTRSRGPGWQAMPRSPAAQSPAGRLCSTCFRPFSRSAAASSSLGRRRGTGTPRPRSRRRGGGEALQEGQLVEEHRQVGGEFRHGVSALGARASARSLLNPAWRAIAVGASSA